MHKYIITADDYGYSPIIDDAIQSAAMQGKITAVACFPNAESATGKFTLSKAKNLKKAIPDLSIGMHFTVTSGKRMNPSSPTLSPKSGKNKHKFRTPVFQNVGKFSLNQLIEELNAQVDIFERHGLDIEFFSDHHGILSANEDGLRSMMEVISDYCRRKNKQVPLRNPMLLGPYLQDNSCLDHSVMYSKARLGLGIKNLFRNRELEKIKFDRKSLLKQLETVCNSDILTPDYFIEHYYGKANVKILKCIHDHSPKNPCSIRSPHLSNNVYSEIVVHLALKPPSPETNKNYQEEIQKLQDYRGVAIPYLKNKRVKEFNTLINSLSSVFPQNELTNYKLL